MATAKQESDEWVQKFGLEALQELFEADAVTIARIARSITGERGGPT